jgi:hypothetical protein
MIDILTVCRYTVSRSALDLVGREAVRVITHLRQGDHRIPGIELDPVKRDGEVIVVHGECLGRRRAILGSTTAEKGLSTRSAKDEEW